MVDDLCWRQGSEQGCTHPTQQTVSLGAVQEELFRTYPHNLPATKLKLSVRSGATPIIITVVIPVAEPTHPGVSYDRAGAKCNNMLHTLRPSASEVCLLGLLVPCMSMCINKHIYTQLNMCLYIGLYIYTYIYILCIQICMSGNTFKRMYLMQLASAVNFLYAYTYIFIYKCVWTQAVLPQHLQHMARVHFNT